MHLGKLGLTAEEMMSEPQNQMSPAEAAAALSDYSFAPSGSAVGTNILDAITRLATSVGVPIYTAAQKQKQQRAQYDYQLQLARLKQSAVSPSAGRVYSQGATSGPDFLPWLLLGGAAIAAFFILKK